MSLLEDPANRGARSLADGTVYRGRPSARRCRSGEVVFNTSMTGYQEILTDPVLRRADRRDDLHADRQRRRERRGRGVRPSLPRGLRREGAVRRPEQLARGGRPRRDLARHRRARHRRASTPARWCAASATAAPRWACSQHRPRAAGRGGPWSSARARPGLDGVDWVAEVTCDAPYDWTEGAGPASTAEGRAPPGASGRLKVVAYDFGVKRNILRLLVEQGFDVTVVPAKTSAADALALKPDARLPVERSRRSRGGRGRARAVRERCSARSRCSASASGTRSSASRSAARRRSSSSATTAATSPARTSPRARSRSAPRTTATPSTRTRCARPASPWRSPTST